MFLIPDKSRGSRFFFLFNGKLYPNVNCNARKLFKSISNILYTVPGIQYYTHTSYASTVFTQKYQELKKNSLLFQPGIKKHVPFESQFQPNFFFGNINAQPFSGRF